MGDHMVLMVDQLPRETMPKDAIETKTQVEQTRASSNTNANAPESASDGPGSCPVKLAECKICHVEDEDSNMETPCSCAGSLKYAHRKCVQRWCDEKGDITCEICLQQFEPGYIVQRSLFQYIDSRMNLRADWDISMMDLQNFQLIPTVASDGDYLESEFDAQSLTSLICCRVIVISFTLLLFLRHAIPIIIAGAGSHSSALIMLLMLRTLGILLPVYVLVKIYTAARRRRHQQIA